jgi:hypothetical protein
MVHPECYDLEKVDFKGVIRESTHPKRFARIRKYLTEDLLLNLHDYTIKINLQ